MKFRGLIAATEPKFLIMLKLAGCRNTCLLPDNLYSEGYARKKIVCHEECHECHGCYPHVPSHPSPLVILSYEFVWFYTYFT